MVLASSREGALVLDPFVGSGTTLRVCQQLNRRGCGIEINPEYVESCKVRLAREFNGFDSVDPRMERVPLDLRKPEVREPYLENHKKWFLRNHENALGDFEQAVEQQYPSASQSQEQLRLLESPAKYEAQ